jgi:hypothetical protein
MSPKLEGLAIIPQDGHQVFREGAPEEEIWLLNIQNFQLS